MGQYDLEPREDSKRLAAASMNLLIILIITLAILIAAWWVFTGPLSSLGAHTSNGNINPPTIHLNPPANTNPSSNNLGQPMSYIILPFTLNDVAG